MDINSLLSPSETPRANSLTPATSGQGPYKFVQRTLSTPARSMSTSLSRSIFPPSSIPAHIRSPSQQPAHSSPLISPVPSATSNSPHILRTSSTPNMDTLADVASMQSHQQNLPTPPAIKSRDSDESQKSTASPFPHLSSLAASSRPRGSFDIAMVDTSKQNMRTDFAGSSLSLESQTQLSALLAHVQETPAAYESHVEIIKILHQGFVDHIYPSDDPNSRRDPRTYDLLNELRQARENMDKLFAVGESQWLDWLQDESILAQTAEERVAVVDKCRRAVEEEYGSIRLWVIFGDWIYHCHLWAQESNDADLMQDEERLIGREVFDHTTVLDTWDEASEKTKYSLSQSHLVWDKYIRVRFPLLDQKMSPEDATAALELFQTRLQTSHAQWDQTFQTFSSFVSANFANEEYEEIMSFTIKEAAEAKRKWSERETFETAIFEAQQANDENAEYNAFSQYIEFEQSDKVKQQRKRKEIEPADPKLVDALYQRAELRYPSALNIWEAHILYMIENGLPNLLETLSRATKHCPWSGTLWKRYLLSSEIADEPYQETENLKHRATSTGLLDAAGIEEALKVHDAWCGYLLRRTRRLDATEEDYDVAEMGILSSIEIIQSLASKLGLNEDFDVAFRLQRKYIEYLKSQGRFDNARQQFDDSIKAYGKYYKFWLRFYEFEMHKTIHIESLQQDASEGLPSNSSAPFAVAILKQGLAREDLDYPEYLIEILIQHCEDYEDAEELQSAMTLIQKIEKNLQVRRQNEAIQAATTTATAAEAMQQEAGTGLAQELQDPNGPHTGKRKREDGLHEVIDSNKRLRSEEGTETLDEQDETAEEQPKRDREHARIIVQNLPTGISETKIRQYFSNCGNVLSLKFVPDDKHSVIVEFDDAQAATFACSRDGQDLDGSTINVGLNTGSTLYVTNYPPAADESFIRTIFSKYGEILNVRFPSLQGNKKRRFCYVEFKQSNDAGNALAVDGEDFEGLKIVVKISNPAVRQTRNEKASDGRTIFVGHIPFKASTKDIENEFVKFGEIEMIKVPVDAQKSRNKGIAFITYVKEEDTQSALKMNGVEFQERTLTVNIANENSSTRRKSVVANGLSTSPNPSLNGDSQTSAKQILQATHNNDSQDKMIALTDVPDTVNESRIRAIAEKIGPVKRVILKTNHQGALIEFETIADAGKAAIELDGFEINPGRHLRVTSEQEMKQGKPERKVDKLGLPQSTVTAKRVAPNGLVSRPGQPKIKRGGNLGQRTAAVFKHNSDDGKVGESKDKKSNADFRAMISKT